MAVGFLGMQNGEARCCIAVLLTLNFVVASSYLDTCTFSVCHSSPTLARTTYNPFGTENNSI